MNNVKTIEQAIQRAKEEAHSIGSTVAFLESKKGKGNEAQIKLFKNKMSKLIDALNLLGIMDFMPAMDMIHAEYWKGYEHEQELQITLAKLEYLSK